MMNSEKIIQYLSKTNMPIEEIDEIKAYLDNLNYQAAILHFLKDFGVEDWDNYDLAVEKTNNLNKSLIDYEIVPGENGEDLSEFFKDIEE